MPQQNDVDDIEDNDLDGPGGNAEVSAPKSSAEAAKSEAHLAEVDAQTAHLKRLDAGELNKVLREVIAGSQKLTTEALIRTCVEACAENNERLVKLSFEAVVKSATPLLLSQAWGLSEDEAEEQAQEIFAQLFAAIRAGKSGMAGRFFAAYAKRRSISEHRKREARIEGAMTRIEPEGDVDPIEELPDRIPSAEARALLQRQMDRIEDPEHRAAFIKYHYFEMTQQEIAKEHEVGVRTMHEWLKNAAAAVGLKGEDQ